MSDMPPSHDTEPQPPTLGRLALILGFEPNQTLRDIESTLLLGWGLDEMKILLLFDEYSVEANKMCEAEDKRTPRDDLALMVQLAYLRYFKGRFAQVLQDFEDIRELIELPVIDRKTYILIIATISSVEKEIAEWRRVNPEVE